MGPTPPRSDIVWRKSGKSRCSSKSANRRAALPHRQGCWLAGPAPFLETKKENKMICVCQFPHCGLIDAFLLFFSLSSYSSHHSNTHTICSPQRHPKLPVSLKDVQTEDLHSQPAGRDQGSLGSLLHPSIPEGVRANLNRHHLTNLSHTPPQSTMLSPLRATLSIGTSRGKCGTTCLEKRCSRFVFILAPMFTFTQQSAY